jgi:3-dehydroquinate synthase
VELVLVGLSGSGKTTVARALAERHGAELVDLDERIEATAGRSIGAIFDEDGEEGFRALESQAVDGLGLAGPPDGPAGLTRVIASGGGAVIAPRNRWRLFRGRVVVWLDASPNVLTDRLEGDGARPLLAGGARRSLERLGAERRRWYAAGTRVDAARPLDEVVADVEALLARRGESGTTLLAEETPIGRLVLSDGGAAAGLVDALGRLEARRVAIVSEPAAWRLHGERLAAAVAAAGVAVESIIVPTGERAKQMRVYERLMRDLASRRLERSDPVVAIGGGALGDLAGFAAATYLRGVPLIHVPTTLLAQIDSSIGGKTGIDLPEGKNLVGAFHQPHTILLDVALLASLPRRQVRAALGEAVKVAALGDELLFELLERDGPDLARSSRRPFESGALAELVERCALWKVRVVTADERESAERISLNLGHTFAHGIEAAAGYRGVLHGEAVAHGLRGALAVGRALGVTPADRAERVSALIDRLGLADEPPKADPDAVLHHLAADKKHAAGRLRWVLPTGDGIIVRSDVPEEVVRIGLDAALAGSRKAQPA